MPKKTNKFNGSCRKSRLLVVDYRLLRAEHSEIARTRI